MLIEGLVGVVALIAAASLPQRDLLRHQHRPGASVPTFMAQNPDFAQFLEVSEVDLHGDLGRGVRSATSWSRSSRTCGSRSAAGPAAR